MRHIWKTYSTVIVLIVMLGLFAIASPTTFFTVRNFHTVLFNQAVVCTLAFAVLFPLILGDFDLSLGYTLGFVVVVGAKCGAWGFTVVPTLTLMISAGIIIGLVNAFFIVKCKISSFVVTLGVGTIVTGLSQGLSGGATIYQGVSSEIIAFGQERFFGVAYPIIVNGILAILMFVLLKYLPLGRKMYAVGGSEKIAKMSGINTEKVRVMCYACSGFLASLGGIYQLGIAGSANPSFGNSLLMPAYAAGFLGVVSFTPGRYNLWGTLVAVLIIGFGVSGILLMGAPLWIENAFSGVVLILAVLISKAEAKTSK
ncbi:MAG: ABC transporter permease [Eubacteriales bacterium]